MSEHIDYEKENARRMNALDKTGLDAASNLTVRDYFAAHAIGAAFNMMDRNLEEFWLGSDNELPRLWTEGDEKLIAVNAYELADAMMKERAK